MFNGSRKLGGAKMPNPSVMTVYNGTCPEGEIEDWGRGDIRAWLGVGDERESLGTFSDRKAAMRAVSSAAKAAR